LKLPATMVVVGSKKRARQLYMQLQARADYQSLRQVLVPGVPQNARPSRLYRAVDAYCFNLNEASRLVLEEGAWQPWHTFRVHLGEPLMLVQKVNDLLHNGTQVVAVRIKMSPKTEIASKLKEQLKVLLCNKNALATAYPHAPGRRTAHIGVHSADAGHANGLAVDPWDVPAPVYTAQDPGIGPQALALRAIDAWLQANEAEAPNQDRVPLPHVCYQRRGRDAAFFDEHRLFPAITIDFDARGRMVSLRIMLPVVPCMLPLANSVLSMTVPCGEHRIIADAPVPTAPGEKPESHNAPFVIGTTRISHLPYTAVTTDTKVHDGLLNARQGLLNLGSFANHPSRTGRVSLHLVRCAFDQGHAPPPPPVVPPPPVHEILSDDDEPAQLLDVDSLHHRQVSALFFDDDEDYY
jgi:hypothetical protein